MVHFEAAVRLRNEYARIVNLARETGEAIYLTNNGRVILVLMDAEAFEQRQLLMKLEAAVLDAEHCRFANGTGYDLDDALKLLGCSGNR